MSKPIGLAVVASVLLSACASGPDFHSPAVPDTATTAFTTPWPASDAPVSAHWWKLYNDEALNTLIQQALAANTDLRVAEANLLEASARFRESRSQYVPSTTANAGASYGRDQRVWSGPDRAPTQWSYSGGMDIAYEVDLFGRVRRDVQAAHADRDAIEAARDAARLAVVAETTRAYVDACGLGQSLHIAEQAVAIADKQLQLTQQRQTAGAATQLDVARAAADLAATTSTLSPLSADRQSRLLELAALLAETPANIPAAARDCAQIPTLLSSIPVGDGAALLRRRPDVRAAEYRLKADTARIGVAIASLYPQITLGASASYFRNDTLPSNEHWSFSIGPLLSWHFPNQLAARAQIRQAEARSAATLAEFDGTVLTALKEVEQALTHYQATLQQQATLADAQRYASTAYTLARQRHAAGAATFIEVLDAQRTLIEAQRSSVAAARQLGTQGVAVFRALGGGWETEDSAQRTALR